MMCPSCGCAELVHGTRDWLYWWDDAETVISAVTGDFCPSCNDVVLHGDELRRVEQLMLEFRKDTVAKLRTCDPRESLAMMCPSCGLAELVHGTRDWLYWWDDAETVIPAVTGDFCPLCNDVALHGEESRRVEQLMLEFRKDTVAKLRTCGPSRK